MNGREIQRATEAQLRRRLAEIEAMPWQRRTDLVDAEWEAIDQALWQGEQDRIERARFQVDTPCLPDPWWRNP